jgi:hypothetical protein
MIGLYVIQCLLVAAWLLMGACLVFAAMFLILLFSFSSDE